MTRGRGLCRLGLVPALAAPGADFKLQYLSLRHQTATPQPKPRAVGKGFYRVVFGLFVLCLLPITHGGARPLRAQGAPFFAISPAVVAAGDTFTVDGAGFQDYVTAVHGITLTVFDDNNQIVDTDDVSLDADGSVHTTWYTSSQSGPYPPGSYTMTAFYQYWGVVRDANGYIICDFCPTKTVYLAGPVPFSVD